MRTNTSKAWTLLGAGLLALTVVACGGDKEDEEAGNGTGTGTEAEAGTEVGDGDGDQTGDGDGDQTGDGDGDQTGDGDGDQTGDGDGDQTGDGDGDQTGDGDGEPNPECFALETQEECDANPDCQSVVGSPLKQNGPDAPCLEPQEFIGCIGMQGCGDAITWFCQNNSKWEVPDTCGPEGADQCDPPMDPVEACP